MDCLKTKNKKRKVNEAEGQGQYGALKFKTRGSDDKKKKNA